MVALDTLSFVRRLEKAGVPREHAEAHAEALAALAGDELATKRDIGELKAEIRELDLRLSGRMDQLEAKVDGRIDQLEARLNARIDQLDAKLSSRIDQLNGRIDQVEAKLNGRIDQLDTKLSSRIDQLEGKLTIKLGGMLAAAVAITAALVKLL